ncbi:MAG: HD domain-containing protein [Desulfobacula sp.]|nr:HD domain-containing protein [Desulfobacula sp.]
MHTKETKDKRSEHLYFPLKQLNTSESIFENADKGILKAKYKSIMAPIIGKQLAVNTYYQNDLIAVANTRITIKLLKIFDTYKINFKINKNDVTDEQRDHALDFAMTQIIQNKRTFLNTIRKQNIPVMQDSVHHFITQTISNSTIKVFKQHHETLNGYLDFASSAITSEKKYIATAAALKKVIENEKRIFKLQNNQTGETIEHIVKTALISLLLAQELDDFQEDHYKTLSIICLGHDGGKALIPEEVIYKKGRLTQLENDIMKSHVLLSYILSSGNQTNLNYEAFVMALHHIKEDKQSPQSYSIAEDTHTSFYQYLTTEAQTKLNQIYYSTKNYYRVISIADTFEAISAERVYKKASSIGKTLEIMISCNKDSVCFYPPYLSAFIRLILQTFLPQNMIFKIDADLMNTYYTADKLTAAEEKFYKKNHRGIIAKTCSSLNQSLQCVIYNYHTKNVERKLSIPPMFFLRHKYFK